MNVLDFSLSLSYTKLIKCVNSFNDNKLCTECKSLVTKCYSTIQRGGVYTNVFLKSDKLAHVNYLHTYITVTWSIKIMYTLVSLFVHNWWISFSVDLLVCPFFFVVVVGTFKCKKSLNYGYV